MTLFSGHAGEKKNLYQEIFFFFFFFFFLFLLVFFDVFEIKNVYSDTNLTMRAGE